MVLTFTINPAIDRTVMVDHLAFEDRGYILSRTEGVGGRGINASRVIHSFGGKTHAILAAGGQTGKQLRHFLKEEGFPSDVIEIRNDSRTNLTISDRQGLTIKLNELGPQVSEEELTAMRKGVEKRIGKASWLMICGSIPPGVAPHFYCELVQMASEHKVKTLVDTDGESLLHGLDAHPTVVTPNQHEAERLLNRALLTRSQFLEAVLRIQAMGAASVILSLGSRGVMATDGKETIEVLPPRIDAVCPIGAGDALAAAFAWAMDNGAGFSEALRWGVATGTASAALPGLTFATLEQVKEMHERVEVRTAR